MKIFHSRYTIVDSFNEKFHALIAPLLIIATVAYFLSFIITSFIILLIIVGIVWHYYNVDERLEIYHNGNEFSIEVLGKIHMNESIKKVHHGWSYHFPKPTRRNDSFTSPWMSRSYRNNSSPGNVIVVNIILELSNGKIVNIHQYLSPWNEPPKGWQYVGHFNSQYDYTLKISRGLKKLQKTLSRPEDIILKHFIG